MTRKSYKRKKIILGVSMFASVALISTGFAAWVLASQAEATTQGNITVGTISDSSIKISNVQFKDGKNSFIFEPKQGDENGRVRHDGTNFENLSVTITGEVSPNTYVSSATIEMDVPEGITAAVGKNYLVLPECATAAQNLSLTKKESPDETVSTFEYTITFTWGSAFNEMNPGEYYDEDETGKLVADETMKETLQDLKTCIYNSQEEAPTFSVTIKAIN